MGFSLFDPYSYVASSDSHSLVFHLPKRVRRLGSLLSGACALIMVLLIGDAEWDLRIHPVQDSSELTVVVIAWVVMWGFPALGFFLGNAPHQLCLNLDDRSYVLRRGYKPLVSVWAGTFDDIDKLNLSSKYQSSSMQRLYTILLVWKPHTGAGKKWIILGTTYDKWEAETLVYKYANTLGVRVANNL